MLECGAPENQQLPAGRGPLCAVRERVRCAHPFPHASPVSMRDMSSPLLQLCDMSQFVTNHPEFAVTGESHLVSSLGVWVCSLSFPRSGSLPDKPMVAVSSADATPNLEFQYFVVSTDGGTISCVWTVGTVRIVAFIRTGLAPVFMGGYDAVMIIKNVGQLSEWCRTQAAGQLGKLEATAADHAVACITSVVWRHGIGQGLRLGDDWAWVLSMYGDAEILEIVQAAADSAAADRKRRSRRGF